MLAGQLLCRTARRSGAEILPIDSEHSGLWQCLAAGRPEQVSRVCLTASGGPLLRHADWRRATPREVLDKALHPEDVAQAVLFLAKLPARAVVPEMQLLPSLL